MKKIIITGASGFLGTKLRTVLAPNFEVIGTFHNHPVDELISLNVTDRQQVLKVFNQYQPEIVIHTVALSDPDYCEEHPKEATLINFGGTSNIVEACKQIGAKLIHISTAGVFGAGKPPYNEKDEVCPVNTYGLTKVQAEKTVRSLEDSVILRFDFLYGYNNPLSPNGLISKIISRKRIEANPVQVRLPLLVDDVAFAIQRIIELDGKGIYHLSGPDKITKYELCKRLETTLSLTGNIYPIEAIHQKAKRADDTSLLSDRLKELGVVCKPIDGALSLIKEQYISSNPEDSKKLVERI